MLDVEQRPDAEPRVIVADAADRVHRHAAADGQLDVLDHLPGVQLEHRDGTGSRRGVVRPITLWPFPSAVVADAVAGARAVAVFELNAGQMIEDVELAVRGRVPVHAIGGISHDHSGFGVGPLLDVEHVLARIEALYEGVAA